MKLLKIIFVLIATVFVAVKANAAELPLFSNGAEEHWYLLTYNTSKKVIQDNGAGQTMTAVDKKDNSDSQLWKLVGSPESFTLVSKSNGYVVRDDMFRTYADAAKASKFKLLESNFENSWMIYLPGDEYGCMNNYGSGIGGWTADANDPNNAIRFVAPEEWNTNHDTLPGAPAFSDDSNEIWYVISYANGGRVFTDNGNGKAITHTAAEAGNEAQMWKLVGNVDSFTLVSKKCGYVYKDGPFRTSTDPNKAVNLKLEKAGNPTYTGCFQINYTGDGWGIMNQYGNGEVNGYYNDPSDQNNALMFLDPSSIITRPDMSSIKEFIVTPSESYRPVNRATLWYGQPVTAAQISNPWMEYALPIGNGEFGGMIYGGIHCEEFQFNDKSLWTGSSKSRGCYQNFGDIFIEDISNTFENASVKDYVRYLDMHDGIGGVSYSDGAITYTREYIASEPDKVVAIRLASTGKGKISLRLRLLNNVKTATVSPVYADGGASFEGRLDLIDFKASMRVVPVCGSIVTNSDNIEVKNADEVLVILAGGTNFDPHNLDFISDATAMKSEIDKRAAKAAAKGWSALLADHTQDFQALFNRVNVQFNTSANNNQPTDKLVDTYTAASLTSPEALILEELYFNYGRYLLISSSRGMDSPANLQGIWNNSDNPAWQSDIHSNINVQMNYWLAENTNLSEMHMPYLNYVYSMAIEHPQWGEYAHRSGQSKGWTCFTQNNIFAHSDYAENYVIANAWYTSHLWQHYRYTLDKDFLKDKAFPVMKSCAEFWLERLVTDSDGSLVAPDEWSPEHGPSKENGTAHAQQIITELFESTIKAMEILGNEADNSAFAAELKEKYTRLDKGLAIEKYTRAWGSSLNGIAAGTDILREWKHSSYSAGQNGHRHQSHLMAMYPFGQITPESEYFTPAINSLKLRGDESTGWSLAWKINLWARALNGDKAHTIIRNALRHSTSYGIEEKKGGVYYNLLDSHAPFQIDGNLGFSAAVAEMLLQSYNGKITLLPALPACWTTGKAEGLRAIGNFEVNQTWEGGKLLTAVITSFSGEPCAVSYKGIKNVTLTDSEGAKVDFEIKDDNNIVFTTMKDMSYILTTPEGNSTVNEIMDAAVPNISYNNGIVTVDSDSASISVFDLLGLKILQVNASEADLSAYKDSLVIVKVTTPTGVSAAKICL